MTETTRPHFILACAAAATLCFAAPGEAQRTAAAAAAQSQTAAVSRDARVDVDARQVRADLMDVLEKQPPSVARVLKTDPSLLRNDAYLATYPALQEFLATRPQVAQNPAFYLETVHVAGVATRESQQMERIQDLLGGLVAFVVFCVVLGALVWLIRTVLEQRRWNRLSKIQAEVHGKLMDRFSSNDELMAYVQTPSGRRFLESGPSPLQETPRNIGAPFSRILWSVQAGVVLTVAGLGALFVSGRLEFEASQFFFVIGVLTLAMGAGFVISAVASYGISRKLGLLEPAPSDHA